MTSEILIITPVKDWLHIDGTIDNTVAVEVVGGDPHAVELGQHIRRVGWAQTRLHPRNTEGWGGWPPVDDYLDIPLDPDAWTFIAAQLLLSAASYERIAQDPRWSEVEREMYRSSAKQARRIAEWISRRLAENAE